jgi:hypothetical protein
MFPSLDDYLANPAQENWKVAKYDVDMVFRRIAWAVDSVLSYDASLTPELGSDLAALHSALRSRAGLIPKLPDDPPSKAFLTDWIAQYRIQVSKLNAELAVLEARFRGATFRPNPSN